VKWSLGTIRSKYGSNIEEDIIHDGTIIDFTSVKIEFYGPNEFYMIQSGGQYKNFRVHKDPYSPIQKQSFLSQNMYI